MRCGIDFDPAVWLNEASVRQRLRAPSGIGSMLGNRIGTSCLQAADSRDNGVVRLYARKMQGRSR